MNPAAYIPVNSILVSVTGEYNDVVKAPGGMQFYQDTTVRPDFFRTIKGKVELLPSYIDNTDIGFEAIKPILEIGDEVWFHYLSVSTDKRVVVDEEPYYNVPLTSVFCLRRGGVFTTMGTWCLLRPLYIDRGSRDEGGFHIPESRRRVLCQARATYWLGSMEGTHQGDIVGFWPKAVFENQVEDETIYCMKEDYIYLKYDSAV
jgi:hypothetical protein